MLLVSHLCPGLGDKCTCTYRPVNKMSPDSGIDPQMGKCRQSHKLMQSDLRSLLLHILPFKDLQSLSLHNNTLK